MQLPVAHVPAAVDPATLLRYYHQLDTRWSEHIAESSALDAGVAFANPQLPRVHMASRILDVAVPGGTSPQDAFDRVEAHYAEQKLVCHQWVMNPSAAADRTGPMEEFLVGRGYVKISAPIMRLRHMAPAATPSQLDDVQVIPARSSFRHARELAELKSQDWSEPQLADAAMLHLDDPHYDALMALHGGRAVAYAGLLTMGELGLIEQVYVVPDHRRRGLGRLVVQRLLEIAARGLLKHVLLSVAQENAAAIALYEKLGFQIVGQATHFHRPR